MRDRGRSGLMAGPPSCVSDSPLDSPRRLDTFIQLTLNGLTEGSTYALIALGYTLVYGVLKLLNFAHGDVFMVGSFIGFGVLKVLGGASDPAVPVWLLLTLMVLGAHGRAAPSSASRSSASPIARCATRHASPR